MSDTSSGNPTPQPDSNRDPSGQRSENKAVPPPSRPDSGRSDERRAVFPRPIDPDLFRGAPPPPSEPAPRPYLSSRDDRLRDADKELSPPPTAAPPPPQRYMVGAPMRSPMETRNTVVLPERDNPMPPDLQRQFQEIEEWAQSNRRDARTDAISFWLLKIPGMLGAACAGLFAYFELGVAALILGALGSFCILIDGIHPRGALRNTHLRAYHDLRSLQQRMINRWRTGSLRGDGSKSGHDNLAAEIIEGIEADVNRIGAYVREAETSIRDKPIP
jgi:hypothetical protein